MNKEVSKDKRTGLEVAVVGIAGRFPGAENVGKFWENIKNGVESIHFYTDEELIDKKVREEIIKNPNYVNAYGALKDIEYFDSSFFGYTPGEATVMNPQLRFLHECAWEALEDAGYNPYTYDGLIGVYVGGTSSVYWEVMTYFSGGGSDVGFYAANSFVNKDFTSTMISYKLNLKGPSVTMHTACSTSLLAIHLACRAVLSGECHMALAGAACILEYNNYGYVYEEGLILSPDGHCRAFDAKAGGTVAGDGAAMVVLKRLKNAINDGDHIYAVIKGSAANNDGKRKVGYMAPSVEGQVYVIQTAMAMAQVEPETISYVETHGTGTILGDPIEIEALTLAFNTNKRGFCPIGAVKTNVGHLDVAAGITGFIKTVLALENKYLPPTLKFESPNPKIDFSHSPFFVNTIAREWTSFDGIPRRAGVSAFGIGGTNVHVILEEAPANIERKWSGMEYHLIPLSANTQSALDSVTQNLADHFKKIVAPPTPSGDPDKEPLDLDLLLADTAYTLQMGRKSFKHRQMFLCSSINELVETLSSPTSGKLQKAIARNENRQVVFMFSGQGSQYINMGLDLYQKEPIFKAEMDHCFEIVKHQSGIDMKAILYPLESTGSGERTAATPPQPDINQTEIAQPVLFCFEYALANLLMKWGIAPYGLIGHSIGEYVAACLSGVFTLEEGLKLVVLRGKLMQRMPHGTMLSVALSEKELMPLLESFPELSLAAINSPTLCVVSGPEKGIENLANQLTQKGYEHRLLHTSHAFHSSMMDPILAEFEETVKSISLKKPKIPFISNVTGTWAAVREVTTSAYWAMHLRRAVRFADGISELAKNENPLFVEIGPGNALTTFARQNKTAQETEEKNRTIGATTVQAVNLIKHPKEKTLDHYFLMEKMGQIWLQGVNINWTEFNAGQSNHRVSLPTYPFERQRFWLKSDSLGQNQSLMSQNNLLRKKSDITEWFYLPSWERSYRRESQVIEIQEGTISPTWMVFCDTRGFGTQVVKRLKHDGKIVISIEIGATFEQLNDLEYRLNPSNEDHYNLLFQKMKDSKDSPMDGRINILHLWGVPSGVAEMTTHEGTEKFLEQVFYSLLFIARASQRETITGKIGMAVVTTEMHEVTGEETLFPLKATILGAVNVITKEYTDITCRSIDIDASLPLPDSQAESDLTEQLLMEFPLSVHRNVVAYRGKHRWERMFIPSPIALPNGVSNRLKPEGVYLITGGLGGIGLTLALYLCETVKAKVVLVARTPLSAQNQWVKDKIRECESKGSEVLVLNADVADERQMHHVIAQTRSRFGRIHGVIHSAGLPDGLIIQMRSRKSINEILASKVIGTLLIDRILSDDEPDFFLLCSSLSSVLGPEAQVGYCAANAFLDAFAHYKNTHHGTYTVSVNWDTWQEVGMGVKTVEHLEAIGNIKSSQNSILHGLLPAEGCDVFNRILNSSFPQILVSTFDFNYRLANQNREKETETKPDKVTSSQSTPESFLKRPELRSDYVAPVSETENQLVNVWQNYFGIEPMGIHDDFFEMGGDSLKALGLISMIHRDLNAKIPIEELFNKSTIKELAQFIETIGDKNMFEAIEVAEEKEYYPLSSAQKRMFILHQIEPDNMIYNSPEVRMLHGNLDIKKTEEIFKKLIARHESFRTSFGIVAEEPVQWIHATVDFRIEASQQHELEMEEGILIQNLLADFVRPFDLSVAPLLRVRIIKSAENRYIFMVDMHHIISDGVSHVIMVEEFLALADGRELPPLQLQYKDYSEWQTNQEISEIIKKQEEYWLKQFEGKIPITDLPLDFPRPETPDFEGDTVSLTIDRDTYRRLDEFTEKERDTTRFMVLSSVFTILLSRYSGSYDIILGSPTAGRGHVDLERVIGMFVNMLPLRTKPTPGKKFREFLAEVKKIALGAFSNQDYQYEQLVEKLKIAKDPGHNPLFDHVFAFQQFDISSQEKNPIDTDRKIDLEFSEDEFQLTISRFDLLLRGFPGNESLMFIMEYKTALFKRETVEKMLKHFVEILEQVTTDIDIKIGDISLSNELVLGVMANEKEVDFNF